MKKICIIKVCPICSKRGAEILNKDRVSKKYFEDKDRFADLLNGIIFHGNKVVQADDIQERKRDVAAPVNDTKPSNYIETIRDIVNEVKVKATVTLIALENQSDIHYAMPIKVMGGDYGVYHEQWKRIEILHREKKDLKGAEFLSGFSKEDKLKLSITIVVYLGKKPWDGPRTLKDMIDLEDIPEELHQYVADYPMFLVEARNLEDLEKFQTDLKYVFGYFQNTSDGENLEKYIAENRTAFENMREDAFDFISIMSNSKELKELKTKYRNPKGGVNVCRAITEMIENGEKRGEKRGERRGERRGIRKGRSEGIMIAKKIVQMKNMGKSNEEIARECNQPLELVDGFFGDMELVK